MTFVNYSAEWQEAPVKSHSSKQSTDAEAAETRQNRNHKHRNTERRPAPRRMSLYLCFGMFPHPVTGGRSPEEQTNWFNKLKIVRHISSKLL